MTVRDHLVSIATIVLLSHAALAQFEPPEQAPAPDVNSALGALNTLPPEYQNFVVKVSSDNGTPDPPQWYILAYRGNPQEGLFSIIVANGEIVQEKPSFNVGELFKVPNPIAIERITIDSRSAFDIAAQFAAANDRHSQKCQLCLAANRSGRHAGVEDMVLWSRGQLFRIHRNLRHEWGCHFNRRAASRAVSCECQHFVLSIESGR